MKELMDRKAKHLIILWVFLFILVVFFSGCSGGGGGATTSTPPAQQPATQGSQAASTGTQAGNISTGSTQLGTSLGNPGLTSLVGAPKFRGPKAFEGKNPAVKKVVAHIGKFSQSRPFKVLKARVDKAGAFKKSGAFKKTVFTNQPISILNSPCADSGTYSMTGSFDYDDVTFNYSFNSLTISYKFCKEYGSIYNGVYTMSGTGIDNGSSGSLTSNTTFTSLSIQEFDYDDSTAQYGALLADSTYSNLTMSYTETYSGTQVGLINTTNMTMGVSMNGNMTVNDYGSSTLYAMSFANYINNATSVYSYDINTYITDSTGTITSNGAFSETWKEGSTNNAVSGSFVNYVVSYQDHWDYYNTTMTDYELLSMSGSVTINFTPDNCAEGTFVIQTITPIKYDFMSGLTTQGHLKINGVTDIVYNSDGTIKVTTGDAVSNYESEYDLMTLCDIATSDEDAPKSDGTNGGSVSKATTMTVTSMSNAADMNCYTDVHVNYYNTLTPTSSTIETWYVDWNNGDGCTNPQDYTFSSAARDIDGDTICDVGLDINPTSQDFESGGVEHFTALALPVGYYVVSMNNYSCATDATNNVNIQLGDSVFGPYTCSYTDWDYDGMIPGAWCTVAEIKVLSDGTAEVLNQTGNVNPWNSAPGFPASKKSRSLGSKVR